MSLAENILVLSRNQLDRRDQRTPSDVQQIHSSASRKIKREKRGEKHHLQANQNQDNLPCERLSPDSGDSTFD
jgi:hypothetical protein